MNIDSQQLARALARDLRIAMERETHDAFRSASWGGKRWPPGKEKGMTDLLYGGRAAAGLSSSIYFEIEGSEVRVSCHLPYANIHNEGGEIDITVTPRMKSFFWAQFYKTKNIKWKAMALTKKDHVHVVIPQRQFTGCSETTEAAFQEAAQRRLASLDLIGAVKAHIQK